MQGGGILATRGGTGTGQSDITRGTTLIGDTTTGRATIRVTTLATGIITDTTAMWFIAPAGPPIHHREVTKEATVFRPSAAAATIVVTALIRASIRVEIPVATASTHRELRPATIASIQEQRELTQESARTDAVTRAVVQAAVAAVRAPILRRVQTIAAAATAVVLAIRAAAQGVQGVVAAARAARAVVLVVVKFSL